MRTTTEISFDLELGGKRHLVEREKDGSYRGFLYVIQAENYIKVGFSNRPDRRLYTWFNNDSASPLRTPLKFIPSAKVLGIARCTSKFERAIHLRFRDEQIDLGGYQDRTSYVGHLSDWYPVNGKMHSFVLALKLIPAKDEWYRR